MNIQNAPTENNKKEKERKRKRKRSQSETEKESMFQTISFQCEQTMTVRRKRSLMLPTQLQTINERWS